MSKHSEQTGSIVMILVAVVAIAAIGLIGWQVLSKPKSAPVSVNDGSSDKSAQVAPKTTQAVSWSFDGNSWKSNGTAPDCPNPVLQTPVELGKVTSILYPGQSRGGNYKPHGGFGFADGTNTGVTVKAPLDASLAKASRYIEQGETQYLMIFIAPCGIMYRFDHLLTLTATYQAIMDKLPAAQPDDSRTTNVDNVSIKAGETIATAVGFAKTGNTGMDFGVYDLRAQNTVSKTASFASAHQTFKETDFYGVCWFDLLPSTDAAKVKALPSRDAQMGKTSDYCK